MAGSRFDPGPDGHHDDLTLDELDGLTLAVPADARALDADREQWLREEQADQSGGLARQPSRGRKTRLVLTAAVIVVSMIVAAVSGAVGAFVFPRPASTPPAAPLATAIGPAGDVGGLLPDITLLADGQRVPARNLRPSVIAMVPDDCAECVTWLTEVRQQAQEFGLDVTLVVGPDHADEAVDLVRQLRPVDLDLLIDPYNQLTDTYGADARTLILVRDDGVVTDVLHDPDLGQRLESLILPLNQSLTG